VYGILEEAPMGAAGLDTPSASLARGSRHADGDVGLDLSPAPSTAAQCRAASCGSKTTGLLPDTPAKRRRKRAAAGRGGGGGRRGRPWVGTEAAADNRGVEVEADDRRLGWRPGGSRWGQTPVGGGDEEDGVVGLREGEGNREMS
jgi:hypothetical protein